MSEDKALKNVFEEIESATKELPELKARVWYFSMENGLPELLISGFAGCKFSFNYFEKDLLSRKIPAIEEYYLKNDDHSPLFKVNKIYPSREVALAEIGGYVYGVLTEVKGPVSNNADTDGAA